ncbi:MULTISPECIES: putative lipid II flippase FtsW [Chloracidobacterium]|jgi:cell division protein FtsW|uniref:putative lipid II flippase FtsW n=1 Tax=Chloracidobacterium TaxID=458032 RepID=UPI0002FF1310|nr:MULTISPECIES: putative lipid II flippase FtsW [Chloracidobacterium]QUV79304.1 putative lipid II flippase FtsW [Chloracidobacterium thermophilum]QUV82340.1 putative lipid II flippase FtsW [Chloracidobacterium sp. D]
MQPRLTIPTVVPVSRNLVTFVDPWLLVTTIALVMFGLVMVYSASAALAHETYRTQFHFVLRQGLAALLGTGLLLGSLWLGYARLERPWVVYGLLGVTVSLLVLVLLLPPVRGTHRFIRLPGLMFQPSELAKLAMVLFLAYFLSRKDAPARRDPRQGLLPVGLVVGLLMGLVFLGRDLGTILMMGGTATAMLVVAGVPLRYPALAGLLCSPLLLYALLREPYRRARLLAFLDPWKAPREEGFQIVQSLMAVGSGGVSGVGFAQSRQKLFYLPEAHTDFIFSVIAEEVGLIGSLMVVGLFGILAFRGLRAAFLAPDDFGKLLATGVTVLLVGQALFNLSVVLSLVPAKGIPLPFISYGGSSMMMSLLAVGWLLSVSRRT